jgi:1-acyl-sn-glycerol-3-phosphate acyltransferase
MYYIIKCVAKLVIFLTTSFKIQGKENIPQEGPLLIVSNHLSVGDPVFIGTSMRRKVIFMAKEEIFRNPLAGYFIRQFGAFPVYRGGASIEALRQAKRILEQGKVLGMFPEGKRSKSQSLIPGQKGSAMIANNGVTILPLGITGSEAIYGYRWIWKRPRVTLVVGQPFTLPRIEVLTKTQLEERTEIIMRRIAELLPVSYRGEYARQVKR